MKLRTLLLIAALAFACGPKPAPTPPKSDDVTSGTGTATGGTTPTADALPLWPAVKKGVLPNGLTYYVLKHGKPEQRADLWLAVNAGSVDEDEDQRGLAHFVEHMAFNGTKRFPKNALVNYIESIGMKFGADVNAYTKFDETVYQLQVPTDDAAALGKGFDILRDWAGDVSFDAAEVDKERGVVLEEWRLGRGAQQRLLDKLIKLVFAGSKYADRLPIGLPEILKGAPRDALVRFYKDWYRPDLMAVIAVGDFQDVAAIEKQIVEKFGSLPKAEKPRAKQSPGTPTKGTTRIAIETDKEIPVSLVAVGNLLPRRPESTKADFRRSLAEQLYQLMLNERMQAIARRPDAPFMTAAVLVQNITREVDTFIRFAVVKNDDVEAALKSLFAEVLRVEQHGFVQSELDRARAILVRGFEQSVAEAATRDSRDLTEELVRNFFEREFVVGREAERDMALEVLPKIELAELNSLAKTFGGAENRVIVAAGPEGKPMPKQERVLALIDEVGKQKIEAWQDEAPPAKLIAWVPEPVPAVAETKVEKLGVTEWTFKNGVRVIVKPTTFEKDAVSIFGSSPGGLAMAPAKDFNHARFAAEIAAAGGVGELDALALGKALAGKKVDVSASIDETTEEIEGSGSVRDLETILQLVHLRMTSPRKDPQAFEVWQRNTVELLANEERSPEAVFTRRSIEALWQKHPRRTMPEVADVKQVSLDKAIAFYADRFGDASDFTFVIVGEVDLAKLKPLVETYLGTLPSKGRKEKEKDAGMRRVGGVVKKTWNLGQDQDKASVQLVFHGDEAWTRDKERDMFILGEVLGVRLREILREDMGGVYGVGARGQLVRTPRAERTFSIRFGCAPGAVDKLVAAAHAEIETIAKQGIAATYLDKVKQTFVREREVSMRTNSYWVDWLSRAARFGDDPTLVLDPAPVIARMTSDNVKAAAARYLDKKRLYQATMLPGKK